MILDRIFARLDNLELRARIFARFVVIAFGIIVMAFGTVTIIGYAIDAESLVHWGASADHAMAPNTAIAFCLTGLALIILGASDRVWLSN